MGSTSTIGEQGITLEATTCRFPRFCRRAQESFEHPPHQQQRRLPILVTRVALDSHSALALAPANDAYFIGVVKTAWAVLLRCYTDQDQVSFFFSCDDDAGNNAPGSTAVRFTFSDAEALSVADVVAAAAAASAKDPPGGTAVSRWSQFILRGEVDCVGRDTPGCSIDTAVLVTSGRNGSVLGRVPKLQVCANNFFLPLSYLCSCFVLSKGCFFSFLPPTSSIYHCVHV
jgi:hypothetical protein